MRLDTRSAPVAAAGEKRPIEINLINPQHVDPIEQLREGAQIAVGALGL
jgi:hypothetical protein